MLRPPPPTTDTPIAKPPPRRSAMLPVLAALAAVVLASIYGYWEASRVEPVRPSMPQTLAYPDSAHEGYTDADDPMHLLQGGDVRRLMMLSPGDEPLTPDQHAAGLELYPEAQSATGFRRNTRDLIEEVLVLTYEDVDLADLATHYRDAAAQAGFQELVHMAAPPPADANADADDDHAQSQRPYRRRLNLTFHREAPLAHAPQQGAVDQVLIIRMSRRGPVVRVVLWLRYAIPRGR